MTGIYLAICSTNIAIQGMTWAMSECVTSLLALLAGGFGVGRHLREPNADSVHGDRAPK
ncbi:hypothetical protein QP172_05160 [Corynebacterium coyleae]|uniref:hypothetical protein n=1 Tax=Corynebacterium coyleae TaxID=53374 RepID=UPI002550A4AE|nr:hypothetical protein [Corynebacterium coyleae]MDK6493117.1 hypothetical protein [Corynebacterium coyleae]